MIRKLRDLLISERLVMAVILLNTIVLTASGFYADGAPEKRFLDAVDFACVVFFVIEALLKIQAYTWKGYFASGWNRFDFFVTLFCLPVLLTPILGEAHLTWAPIVRTGRLFRLFRLLRFIPDVDGLGAGIRRALRASVGVFLALFLVNLIIALMAHFIYAEDAPEMFGDPARAFYSIFRIFIVEGWNDFPDALEVRHENISWVIGTRIFFGITVLICGMLGFSLANAVFIDEMMMDNNNALEKKIDEMQSKMDALESKLDLLLQSKDET